MASDFEYQGIQNHQYKLVERSTGMVFHVDIPGPDDEVVLRLLDGDEVEITNPNSTRRYSLRERRWIG